MMIQWRGKHCSDGCPFFELSICSDDGLKFHSPQCRLSGHRDETGDLLDIRPRMAHGGWDEIAKRPKNCPFEDVHGVHVEVHNDPA